MKLYKYLILYILVSFFLFNVYDPETFQSILFHYPAIDIRYFMFMLIQIFWITSLFQIVYQYICLYIFMRIRLSIHAVYHVITKQFLWYLSTYFAIHIILFTILSLQIPYFLLFLCLLIQTLSFVLVVFMRKSWNYSYIFIIIFLFCLHFVV